MSMHTHCLTCGQIIFQKRAIPWPVSTGAKHAPVMLEADRNRWFIRCPTCGKRNFFIKEYAH